MVMEHVGGGELFEYIIKHGKVSQSLCSDRLVNLSAGYNQWHKSDGKFFGGTTLLVVQILKV